MNIKKAKHGAQDTATTVLNVTHNHKLLRAGSTHRAACIISDVWSGPCDGPCDALPARSHAAATY